MLTLTRLQMRKALLSAFEQKELSLNFADLDPIAILIKEATGELDGRWYPSMLYYFDRVSVLPEGVPPFSHYIRVLGLSAEEILMMDALWEGSKLGLGGERHPLPGLDEDAPLSDRLERILAFLAEDVVCYA